VSQVLGDGILAFVGVPVAHEDDPQRAVRSGLDLIREMRRYGTSPQHPDGSPQVRVGINTGSVVTRDVSLDGSTGDYTPLGDAVNVAARLQAEAAPNTVLIGPATYGFVSHSVNATPRGPLMRWLATADVSEVDIPDTLHGLLLARIDRLPPEVRRTLRVASVIGRHSPHPF
jgi:class 3 adenylate cyclase